MNTTICTVCTESIFEFLHKINISNIKTDDNLEHHHSLCHWSPSRANCCSPTLYTTDDHCISFNGFLWFTRYWGPAPSDRQYRTMFPHDATLIMRSKETWSCRCSGELGWTLNFRWRKMIFPKSLVFVRRKLGTTGCSLVQALPLLCSFYSNVSKAGLILEYFFLVSFSSSRLELSDLSRGLQYKGLTIRKVTNTNSTCYEFSWYWHGWWY